MATLGNMDKDKLLQEYRCVCNKLLFKGYILKGGVQVKCKKCSRIQHYAVAAG
jgi:phage FluMu protein Com